LDRELEPLSRFIVDSDSDEDEDMNRQFRTVPPRHQAPGAYPPHQRHEAPKFKPNPKAQAWSPGGNVPTNGVMTYNTMPPTHPQPMVTSTASNAMLNPLNAGPMQDPLAANDQMQRIKAAAACEIINNRVIMALKQHGHGGHQDLSPFKRKKVRKKNPKFKYFKDPNLTNPNNPSYQGPSPKKWRKLRNAKLQPIHCAAGPSFHVSHEGGTPSSVGSPTHSFGSPSYERSPRRNGGRSECRSAPASASKERPQSLYSFRPHSKPKRDPRRTMLVPVDSQRSPQRPVPPAFQPKMKRVFKQQAAHRSSVPSRSPPPPPMPAMSVSTASPNRSPVDIAMMSSSRSPSPEGASGSVTAHSVLPPGFDKNSIPKTGTKRMAPAHANIQSVISANGGIFHPCHGYSTRDISIFDVFPGIVKYQSKRYSEWNRVEFLLSQSEKPFCGVNGRPLGVNEAEMWFVALKYLFNDITLGQFDFMTDEMQYIIRQYMATHKKRIVFLTSIRKHGFLRVISDISKKLPRDKIKKQMAEDKRRKEKKILGMIAANEQRRANEAVKRLSQQLARQAMAHNTPPVGTFTPNVNPYLAVTSAPASVASLSYPPAPVPGVMPPAMPATQPPLAALPPNPYAFANANGTTPVAPSPQRPTGGLLNARSVPTPAPIVPRQPYIDWTVGVEHTNEPVLPTNIWTTTGGDAKTLTPWKVDAIVSELGKEMSTPNLPPDTTEKRGRSVESDKNADLSLFINAMEFVPSSEVVGASGSSSEHDEMKSMKGGNSGSSGETMPSTGCPLTEDAGTLSTEHLYGDRQAQDGDSLDVLKWFGGGSQTEVKHNEPTQEMSPISDPLTDGEVLRMKEETHQTVTDGTPSKETSGDDQPPGGQDKMAVEVTTESACGSAGAPAAKAMDEGDGVDARDVAMESLRASTMKTAGGVGMGMMEDEDMGPEVSFSDVSDAPDIGKAECEFIAKVN